eukprot:gene2853-4696_t
MSPTLHNNDIILVKKFKKKYDINDLIIFRKPNENILVVKRISGLSGDIVHYDGESTMIPKGKLWVEGDNKNNSIDSFDYGPISKGLVIGNPILIIHPFNFDKSFLNKKKLISFEK